MPSDEVTVSSSFVYVDKCHHVTARGSERSVYRSTRDHRRTQRTVMQLDSGTESKRAVRRSVLVGCKAEALESDKTVHIYLFIKGRPLKDSSPPEIRDYRRY